MLSWLVHHINTKAKRKAFDNHNFGRTIYLKVKLTINVTIESVSSAEVIMNCKNERFSLYQKNDYLLTSESQINRWKRRCYYFRRFNNKWINYKSNEPSCV
ncbi:MAG: hypothetical protein ACTS4X_01240 [Candidatus Hodgkinia cicadicola]